MRRGAGGLGGGREQSCRNEGKTVRFERTLLTSEYVCLQPWNVGYQHKGITEDVNRMFVVLIV